MEHILLSCELPSKNESIACGIWNDLSSIGLVILCHSTFNCCSNCVDIFRCFPPKKEDESTKRLLSITYLVKDETVILRCTSNHSISESQLFCTTKRKNEQFFSIFRINMKKKQMEKKN